jgi:hypothetical protein
MPDWWPVSLLRRARNLGRWLRVERGRRWAAKTAGKEELANLASVQHFQASVRQLDTQALHYEGGVIAFLDELDALFLRNLGADLPIPVELQREPCNA